MYYEKNGVEYLNFKKGGEKVKRDFSFLSKGDKKQTWKELINL
jgi:hypothetical protein